MKLCLKILPVSYTHLDVYKRQGGAVPCHGDGIEDIAGVGFYIDVERKPQILKRRTQRHVVDDFLYDTCDRVLKPRHGEMCIRDRPCGQRKASGKRCTEGDPPQALHAAVAGLWDLQPLRVDPAHQTAGSLALHQLILLNEAVDVYKRQSPFLSDLCRKLLSFRISPVMRFVRRQAASATPPVLFCHRLISFLLKSDRNGERRLFKRATAFPDE